MVFPDQRSDPSCNCNLYLSCSKAESFNPLCQAGYRPCILVLMRQCRSHWATLNFPFNDFLSTLFPVLNPFLFDNLEWFVLLLFFSVILGLHPQHMEVPRLGVNLELLLLAYASATASQIWAASVTNTIAQGNARYSRPGVEPVSSWIRVRFISAKPRLELQEWFDS